MEKKKMKNKNLYGEERTKIKNWNHRSRIRKGKPKMGERKGSCVKLLGESTKPKAHPNQMK